MQKRFFIQIIVVAILAVLSSSLYYYGVCHGLRMTREAIPGKLNHMLYDTSSCDAVFIGSSRVLRNIDPHQFDSLTGIRSYNAGIDGANLSLMDMITRRFIQVHHKPKYVFINLDTYTMEKDSSFFYFPQFFPHTGSLDTKSMMQVEPKFSLAEYYPFLAVSYMDDYLKGVAFHTLSGDHTVTDTISGRRGFSPIIHSDYQGTADEFPLQFNCETDGFRKLDSLCAYCTMQGCRVVFIMAPIYRATNDKGGNAQAFYSLLRPIEARYNVAEINLLTDPRFNKELFFNMSHLNGKGARLYTRALADSFNRISSPAPPASAIR